MNIYSLVPHIDYPVALCSVRSGPRSVHIEGVTTHLQNIENGYVKKADLLIGT